MLRPVLSLIFVLIASTLHAQQAPILDSITIDEDSSILVCHGKFDVFSTSIVRIADTTLTVLSQNDTEIRAAIPVIGHGSAGPVTIESSGKRSSPRLLTYLHFAIDAFVSYHSPEDNGYEYSEVADSVNLRGDLKSSTSNLDTISLLPSRSSKYHHLAKGSNGYRGFIYGGPTYDSTGMCHSLYRICLSTKQIIHPCFPFYDKFGCSYPCDPISLDSTYTAKPNWEFCRVPSLLDIDGGMVGWSATSNTEFAPTKSRVNAQEAIKPKIESFTTDATIVNFQITIPNPSQVNFQFYNVLGKLQCSTTKTLSEGENDITLNIADLSANAYILRIRYEGHVQSIRFLRP